MKCLIVVCMVVLPTVLATSGCNHVPTQGKDSPSGTWQVDVPRFSFPVNQRLAHAEEAVLIVRNLDSRPIPSLAITLSGFSYRNDQAGLADPARPAWIVDSPPAGSVSVYDDTYTFGRIGPGQSARLVWKVTPVRTGTYKISYSVAAGLSNRSKAVLPDGSQPTGSQESVIADRSALEGL